MKKSLEDFIRQNKGDFDHRTPSERVWENILAGMSKQTSWWNSVVVWRVAAVILLGLSSYLFLTRSGAPLPSRELAGMTREFTDVESFYKSQIAEKVALIEHFDNGSEDDHFTQDLQKLDAMYQVLRDEMKTKPSEKVKDALVLNMLVRIDLLNQQIKKLEDMSKPKPKDVSI
jgi:hypothetical protein